MTSKASLLFLLIVCGSCSTSFPIRASLDRSAWFASLSNGTPKIYQDDKLSLIFTTDLSHPELEEKTTSKATGCKGKCRPTQSLLLSNIPLQPGFYRIAQSRPDSIANMGISGIYSALGVEQVITRNYERADGWLQITQYDTTTGQLKGKFDIRFQENNDGSRSVHFRRGKLNFLVKKKQLT